MGCITHNIERMINRISSRSKTVQAEVFEYFRRNAKASDRHAFYLGVCYDCGIGTQKNVKIAARYFHKAAATHPVAQYNLSIMYRFGEGVPQSDRKAFLFAQKAARQGDSEAMRNLGYYMFHGVGTRRNRSAGYNYYVRASRMGDMMGRHNAALCQLDGEGTTMNRTGALRRLRYNVKMGYRPSVLTLRRETAHLKHP